MNKEELTEFLNIMIKLNLEKKEYVDILAEVICKQMSYRESLVYLSSVIAKSYINPKEQPSTGSRTIR